MLKFDNILYIVKRVNKELTQVLSVDFQKNKVHIFSKYIYLQFK